MMGVSFDLVETEAKGPACKGLFFRVRVSRYTTRSGVIGHKREYRPLKRMSCPGCDKCGWMWDDLADHGNMFLDGGKDGEVVQLKMANISHDYETGYVDGYDLAFVTPPLRQPERQP